MALRLLAQDKRQMCRTCTGILELASTVRAHMTRADMDKGKYVHREYYDISVPSGGILDMITQN